MPRQYTYRYKCPKCGKPYAKPSHFTSHIRKCRTAAAAAPAPKGDTMRATTFRFDGPDTVYSGFTADTTWNGWDEVYVTPDVRDAIAVACEDDGSGGATSADLRSLPVEDGLVSLSGYCTVTAREVCADCGLTSAARCGWGADRCGDCSLNREEAGEQDKVCRAHGAYLPDPEAR